MAYQVIARKWRPQSFTELVGQTHISKTLLNALKNDRLPHALLFTGPRGTGKTSSARIFAKSLRCQNAKDFAPCNTCQSCIEISQGSDVDVIEIDGASNNGVDSIRDLREGVAFMPASGKYKIYIIDEVHMLSTSAFNALLKTLEEPPSHVVFIMATTEVQKIPQTILSRCQRFDFRRISARQITDRLKLICETDGVTAHEDALWAIARQGDGSMRDSQSLLDQVITFADGDLTLQTVSQILGMTDRALIHQTLDAIFERNYEKTLSVIEKIASSGVEPFIFAQELLEFIRNLLLIKVHSLTNGQTNGSNEPKNQSTLNLIELSDSEYELLKKLSAQVSEESLHLFFDILLKGSGDLNRAQDPRFVLEVLLLKLTSVPRIADLNALITQLQNFSGDNTAWAPNNPTTSSSNTATRASKASQSHTEGFTAKSTTSSTQGHARIQESQQFRDTPQGLESMKKALEQHKRPQTHQLATGATPNDRWLHLVELVRQQDALFAAKIENLLFINSTENTLHLGVPTHLSFLKDQLAEEHVRKKLQSFIDSFWGSGYAFDVATGQKNLAGESAQSMQKKIKKIAEDELKSKIAEHPKIKTAQNVFKGAIKSINEIKKS